jgi:hypothetical protein
MRNDEGTIQQEQAVGSARSLECSVEVARALDWRRLKLQA